MGWEKTEHRLRSVLLHAVFAACLTDQYGFLFSTTLCYISSILNKKLTGLGDYLSLLCLCSSTD